MTKEIFIKKSNEIFGDKFNYSLVEYKNVNTKVKIICSHGVLNQKPEHHLRGQFNCKKCRLENLKNIFKEKAIKIHGNKYDYSLIDYKGAMKKIKIICKKHGIFEQVPSGHLQGYGCKKCIFDSMTFSTDYFVSQAKKVHGNKYDYSLADYKGKRFKVKIICKKHGIFEQLPQNHIKYKNDCPKCSGNGKLTTKEFIERAKKIHGDKYDYSQSIYINKKEKINILCKIHGPFEIKAGFHLLGVVCPKCSRKNVNTEIFISRAKKIHNNKFNYSLVDYKGKRLKVKIICPTHGVFEQEAGSHLYGSGCKLCVDASSKAEKEIAEFIKSNQVNILTNHRKVIKGELDIYIPSLKLAFEYNGIYWHSEINKNNNYHFNKTTACEKKDITLIHIYEDDWKYKKTIVKSKILKALGKIYKTKTNEHYKIHTVDSKTKEYFLKQNCLYGNIKSKINIGLFLQNTLVSICCFSENKDCNYVLLRFCDKLDCDITNSLTEILKYFYNNFNIKTIKTNIDRSWANEVENYLKSGFIFIKYKNPSFYYVYKEARNKLPPKTGKLLRIYDSGSIIAKYSTQTSINL